MVSGQPIDQIVVEKESPSRRFLIQALLGSGYLGAVYSAVEDTEGSSGSTIAVKIPHANMSAEMLERFWQELWILPKLYKQSKGLYFPKAWRGRIEDTDRDVICMTLVKGKRLQDYFNKEYRLDEVKALEIGLQYARMIACLHKEKISCPDRKASDLYWDDAQKQLTVLDWNVVDTDANFRGGDDIATFGRLWFEFLTGGLPPARDIYGRRRFESVPGWLDISLGTRSIVEKALSPIHSNYTDAEELEKDLETHLASHEQDAALLIRDTRSAWEDAGRASRRCVEYLLGNPYSRSGEFSTEWQNYKEPHQRAHRLLDLASRRRDTAQQLSQLSTQLKPIPSLVDELLTEVQNAFNRDYKNALQIFDSAERRAKPALLEILTNEEGLRLSRWRLLAEAGDKGLQDIPYLYLSTYQSDLRKVISSLENEKWKQAEADWAKIKSRLQQEGQDQTPAGILLGYLQEEIHLRLRLKEANERHGEGNYREEAKILAQVRATLNRGENHPYLKLLISLLKIDDEDGPLKNRAEQAEKLANVDAFLSRIDESVPNDIKAALSELKNRERSEQDLGGLLLKQDARSRVEKTRELLELLIHCESPVYPPNSSVLLAIPNGILNTFYMLDEEGPSAISSVCRQAMQKRSREILAQLVEPLRNAPVDLPPDQSWQWVRTEAEARQLYDLIWHLKPWIKGDRERKQWMEEMLSSD